MALKDFNFDSVLYMVSKYLDKTLMNEVLQLIPVERLWAHAVELKKKQMTSNQIRLEEGILLERCFLESLIVWFKNEFFSWFDTPHCTKCENSNCEKILNVSISPEPYIDNTEIFECKYCKSRYYFERYNDPYKLLQTRRGRCSEFTQVFTVMCFALKYEARFIYDTNDHAWTEVYSHLQGRWIHCDPSEGIVDKPLMYELGWGKKPTLILSFSPTSEIQDVTWRYSSDHKGVLNRREPDTNDVLLNIISRHNKHIFENCTHIKRQYLFKRLIRELAEFMTEPKPTEVYTGRVSGSLEWREERGEVDPDNFYTGYTFQLELGQVKMNDPKYYCMWYSSNIDTYIFYCDKGVSQIKKGWNNCIYSCSNIMRKVELDWKQSYLARAKNGKPGNITWKFDMTRTKFLITGIYIKTNVFHLERGIVECKVINKTNNISFKNGTEFFCSSLLPENNLLVEVTLCGGKGEASWQQAQIGRQSKDDCYKVSFGVVLYLNNTNYQ